MRDPQSLKEPQGLFGLVAAHVVKQHHMRLPPLRPHVVEVDYQLIEEELNTVLVICAIHKLE